MVYRNLKYFLQTEDKKIKNLKLVSTTRKIEKLLYCQDSQKEKKQCF